MSVLGAYFVGVFVGAIVGALGVVSFFDVYTRPRKPPNAR